MEQKNLVSGLHDEIVRVRELLQVYESIPQGVFAATMLRIEIKTAENALASGDPIEIMRCLKQLEGCN